MSLTAATPLSACSSVVSIESTARPSVDQASYEWLLPNSTHGEHELAKFPTGSNAMWPMPCHVPCCEVEAYNYTKPAGR